MKNENTSPALLFDKVNYALIVVGIALMVIGFLLMSGGQSTNPEIFNREELYSGRRITLAPILVLLGLCVEIIAILRKPKNG